MTLEEVKKNCREGWIVNTNEKVVNAIINRINKCNGECPCSNTSIDKRCPCSNYRITGHCCCGLYVEKEVEVKSLHFFKQNGKWYADVPNHTLDENEIVFGCDTFLNMIAQDKGDVTVTISDEWARETPILKLRMKEHNEDGATYSVDSIIPIGVDEMWFCNVTHDIFGEHPNTIYVYDIE